MMRYIDENIRCFHIQTGRRFYLYVDISKTFGKTYKGKEVNCIDFAGVLLEESGCGDSCRFWHQRIYSFVLCNIHENIEEGLKRIRDFVAQ